MLDRARVPWLGWLLFGGAITAFAQDPFPNERSLQTETVRALSQRGADALAAGDSAQARAAFDQLLGIGRQARRLDLVWQAQRGLGRAALSAHDPLTAITHLEQSVAAYEEWRAAAPLESQIGRAHV